MTNQNFDTLAEKYLSGECSPEEIALLEQWAKFHFDEQSSAKHFDSVKTEEETRDKIWRALRMKGREKPRGFIIKWVAGIAASLLFLIVCFYGFQDQFEISPQFHKAAHVPTKVILPDGSVVTLEEGASIVADKKFGLAERKVWLKGEAFFEVTPNPQVPFIVMTGDLVTEVLGTSFRIKPEKGRKQIDVSVVTGKVSIYTVGTTGKNKKDGVIATPNQKISYDEIQKTLRQDLVDVPRPVLKIEPASSFHFDEEPVGKVLARIGEIYGVQLISGNSNIRQCIFTGDLTGLDMYRQLDFLCEVIGAKYEVRGAAIFVTGPGCQPATINTY